MNGADVDEEALGEHAVNGQAHESNRSEVGVDVEVRSEELGFSAVIRVPEDWIPTEPVGATRAVVIDPDRWVGSELIPNVLIQVTHRGAAPAAEGGIIVSDRTALDRTASDRTASDGAGGGGSPERRVQTVLLEMLGVAVVEQIATVAVDGVEARLAVSASEAQWPRICDEVDDVVASLDLRRTVAS